MTVRRSGKNRAQKNQTGGYKPATRKNFFRGIILLWYSASKTVKQNILPSCKVVVKSLGKCPSCVFLPTKGVRRYVEEEKNERFKSENGEEKVFPEKIYLVKHNLNSMRVKLGAFACSHLRLAGSGKMLRICRICCFLPLIGVRWYVEAEKTEHKKTKRVAINQPPVKISLGE